jgi:REP element-mobilizing transposase RayT
VYSRGNARQTIFLDDHDYVGFLGILERATSRFGWLCHAYCLMPNHVHLFLETPEPTLAAGMRHLKGSYAQRFNRRYERVGHVFQGPYGSELVDTDAYFVGLCRYVAWNPVRARLCDSPFEWPWSSAAATAGEVQPPPFLTVARIHEHFAAFGRDGPSAYRDFLLAGLPMSPDPVPGPVP